MIALIRNMHKSIFCDMTHLFSIGLMSFLPKPEDYIKVTESFGFLIRKMFCLYQHTFLEC